MKINARQVKEVGKLTATVDISPQEIDANPPFGVAYQDPFKCRVSAAAIDDQILIQGQLGGRARLTCSRCIEEFDHSIDTSFEMTAAINQGDVELSGEISQAVVLVLPMKPLCQDQCKGLCPHCGQNLNKGGCSCKPEPAHPGLAPLKNLL